MRVVVTGAAGHIGRRVAAELTARGHEVVPVDRAVPGDSGDLGSWHVGDVRDAGFMGALMARTRPDALVHLAAIPRPGLGSPLEVFATNTEATFVALEAAAGQPGVAGDHVGGDEGVLEVERGEMALGGEDLSP
jgi:nucleoside-diphosphate-sugar epimerase